MRRQLGTLRRWVLTDDARDVIATVILSLTTLAVVLINLGEGGTSLVWGVLVINVGWTVFAVVVITLTHTTYSRLSHEELALAVKRRPRKWVQRVSGMAETTSWMGPVSVMALAVAIFALMLPERTLVTQATALVCAISCWVLVATMQALVYARLDLVGHSSGHPDRAQAGAGGLEFRQPEPTRFVDYIYLSLGVQAALAHPGVELVNHRARGEITRHLVVSFIFNSGIIAVLVALLLGIVQR